MKIKKQRLTIFSIVLFISMIFSFSLLKTSAEETRNLYIDYPRSNQVYNYSDITISGWAIDKSAVSKVEIFKDNIQVGNADYGIYRADVNKAYPGYPSGNNSGFKFILSKDKVSNGYHTLKVKATGTNGGYLEKIVRIEMKKLPTKIYLDTPKINQTYQSGDITVKGWAVNNSGVDKILVYIDDQLTGRATYGLLRSDVNKAYPGYPSGDNSGFSYNIDSNSVSAGSHTVKTKVFGKDGDVSETFRKIYVSKLTSKLYIDNPTNYKVYNNKNIYISGWAANPNGVKNVQILLDGKLMGQATYGLLRTDVNKACPGYPSGNNSGYSYNLDVNLVAPGNRLIKVISNGNDGTKLETTRWISVTKLPQRLYIDTPNLSKYYNDIIVKGWALNTSGVTKIDVLLDGRTVGQATYGLLRSDVNKAYPGYPSGDNSGYNFVIDKDVITNGSHKIEVKVYGKDGTSLTASKNFSYEKLVNKIAIENPLDKFTSDNQNISVKGYALIPSGTSKIDVFVDNMKIGSAVTGISRSDIGLLYNQYSRSSTSGYSYTINADSIAPGTHSLKVSAYGNDGTSATAESSFELNKPVNRIYVDSITDKGTYYQNDLRVSGWALNASGINKVNVYLNNKLLGQAVYGSVRSDVNNAYPGYKNGTNSGYAYTISKSALIQGTYPIKVEEIGNDGTILSITKTITVYETIYSAQKYTFDTDLSLQMVSSSPPQTDQNGGGFVNAAKDQVSYYLNPNNFMNDPTYKYQFLVLSYVPGITVTELNSVLSGKGTLSGYGQSFLTAAVKYNVSTAYAAAHALLETGNGTSPLAKGIWVDNIDGMPVTGKLVYDMFGIKVFDSDKNYSAALKYAYNSDWTSVDKAIQGGIKWISANYINSGSYNQNTLYKMKWNPVYPGAYQYATDIGWACKQTLRIRQIMSNYPNAKLVFEIPVYK